MSTEDSSAKAPKERKEYNPYLAGRKEWNERYGDHIKAKKIWQAVAIVSLFVVLLCVAWLGFIGSQNKLIPYLVEVDKLGRSVVVGPVQQVSTQQERGKITKAQLSRFIFSLRTVSTDATLQKQMLFDAYSMINPADPSGALIAEYFGDGKGPNSPFVRAATMMVKVEISTVLKQTDTTWEVEWEEIIRDRKGGYIGKKRMRALLQIYYAIPNSYKAVYSNPTGVFVKTFSWSPQ